MTNRTSPRISTNQKPVHPYILEKHYQDRNQTTYIPHRRSSYYASYSIKQYHPYRRKTKKFITAGIFVFVLILVFAAIITSLPSSFLSKDIFPPKSTPASEWKAGEMPYLYQTDPDWAQLTYSGGSIKDNACGPLCLSMVYIYCTGSSEYDPVVMCKFAENKGYAIQGATSWSFMSEGAELLGLNASQLALDSSRVVSELKAGNPIICIMGPGDFTTSGHFIVLSGINENGSIEVHDPNSATRSNKLWDLETILNQCRGMWVYSS